MHLTLQQFVAASALVMVGSFVQCTLGFGLAVVSAPLLYMVDPALLPGPVLLLALLLSALNIWKNRGGLALGELGGAIAGRVPGMLIGLWILSTAPPRVLSWLLGGSVMLAVIVSLSRVRLEPTPKRLFVVGAIAGLMGTSTSVGGPPIALIYQHATGERIRANLAGYFMFGTVISLIGLTFVGRFGHDQLLIGLALFPAAFLGFVAARYSLRWIKANLIRPALLVVCTLSALSVIVEGFLR